MQKKKKFLPALPRLQLTKGFSRDLSDYSLPPLLSYITVFHTKYGFKCGIGNVRYNLNLLFFSLVIFTLQPLLSCHSSFPLVCFYVTASVFCALIYEKSESWKHSWHNTVKMCDWYHAVIYAFSGWIVVYCSCVFKIQVWIVSLMFPMWTIQRCLYEAGRLVRCSYMCKLCLLRLIITDSGDKSNCSLNTSIASCNNSINLFKCLKAFQFF